MFRLHYGRSVRDDVRLEDNKTFPITKRAVIVDLVLVLAMAAITARRSRGLLVRVALQLVELDAVELLEALAAVFADVVVLGLRRVPLHVPVQRRTLATLEATDLAPGSKQISTSSLKWPSHLWEVPLSLSLPCTVSIYLVLSCQLILVVFLLYVLFSECVRVTLLITGNLSHYKSTATKQRILYVLQHYLRLCDLCMTILYCLPSVRQTFRCIDSTVIHDRNNNIYI